MRIVAFNTLQTSIVCFRINAGDTFSFARRIGEIRVATQAKIATPVNIQFLRIFRMVHCRSVAVFARNDPMQFFGTKLDYLSMARAAVFMHSLTA